MSALVGTLPQLGQMQRGARSEVASRDSLGGALMPRQETGRSTSRARSARQVCTDLNSLCYNSVTGQGQLLWVGFALAERFYLVSMVSINLGNWFDRVDTADAGETIEPEESH